MENEEGGTPEGGAPPATVEASRYDALNEKFGRTVEAKKNLEAEVAQLKAENQELAEKTSGYNTLAQKLQEAEQRAAESNKRFDRFRAIASTVGSTDPEAIEAFEWRYGKINDDNKPDFEAWLEALKKEPETAPAVLRPFLGGATTGGESKPETKPKPRTVPGGSHQQPPQAPSQHSPEEIARIRQEAVQTGDWSKYEAVRIQT